MCFGWSGVMKPELFQGDGIREDIGIVVGNMRINFVLEYLITSLPQIFVRALR